MSSNSLRNFPRENGSYSFFIYDLTAAIAVLIFSCLVAVIKNESPIVDAENEAGTSAEQAFDENLGKILGLETGGNF